MMQLTRRARERLNKVKERLNCLFKIAGSIPDNKEISLAAFFEFGPVLSDFEVAQIEARYRFSLPEEYRAFIQEVGDGGFGFSSLKNSLTEVDEAKFQDPSRPFPHTEPWLLSRLPREAELLPISHYDGTLLMMNYGCTINARLIVTGLERGNIWGEDLGADIGLWPIVEGKGFDPYSELKGDLNRPHLSFLQWYGIWLERQIAMQPNSRFTDLENSMLD